VTLLLLDDVIQDHLALIAQCLPQFVVEEERLLLKVQRSP
jgi:hypothetical protein